MQRAKTPPPFLLNAREGEGIVLYRQKGEKAMSAHHILGLEKVPRVGLFAH